MSAEITVTGSLEFDNGKDIDEALSKIGLRFDCDGTKCIKNVQTIGTSEEALAIGEVTSAGWALFVNLDNTNYVLLRPGTGGTSFIELEPKGGFALFKFSTVSAWTPYAIADTAACRIAYMIVNRS